MRSLLLLQLQMLILVFHVMNGRHTIFGECDLEVVKKIVSAPKKPSGRGPSSEPLEPVVIERIAITRIAITRGEG